MISSNEELKFGNFFNDAVNALTIKAKENAIKVIDKIDLKKPQTKDFLNILKVLGLSDKKSLLILGESNINVYLSSRTVRLG